MSINPTAFEQYLLELINRARADPQAEAARLGIGLNDLLPAGTITAAPKQALVFNEALINAARGHSRWMLDTDTFSHTGVNGSTPTARMLAAGYKTSGSWGTGENIAYTATTGQVDAIAAVLQNHENLFRSAGHRTNILDGGFKEFGTGVVIGEFTSGATYNAMMVTENFGFSGTASYLTGVVIDDGDGDRFYDIGEGVGAVGVKAVGAAGTFETTTWDAGGYRLALPTGSYTVTFTFAGKQFSADATIGGENVKLDARLADLSGTVPLNTIVGTAASETIVGTPGNDLVKGSGGSDKIDTLGGNDTVDYAGARSQFMVDLEGGKITVLKPGGGADTLAGVERISFTDGDLLYDLTSGNAAAAYRLYGGSFDRAPDEGGLRYWTGEWLDKGHSLQEVAARFIDSDEFRSLYGTAISDAQFVDQLYLNVLHRPGEAGGVAFWNKFLADGQGDRAEVLTRFTQEHEYVANSQKDMDDGFWVV
jgi:hypothetical protein